MATRSVFWWGVWLVSMGPLACGDDTPVNNGPALVKFCHQFHRSGRNIDLTLVFGQPAAVSMTTTTGKCAPVLGQPCTDVPRGKVPIRLIEGDHTLLQTTVPSLSGGEYLAYPIVKGLDGLAIRLVPINSKSHCDTLDPLPEVFSSTGLPLEPGVTGAIELDVSTISPPGGE